MGILFLVTFSSLAVVALIVGHLKIASGTASIEQVTVPNVLEMSRTARNLEHLRRYGDTALLAASPAERTRAQMAMTLIITHPSMNTSELLKARVRRAERVLNEALALAPFSSTSPEAHAQALARWALAANDLTLLADELTIESSQRASNDANQIHRVSTQTLSWLTAAIVCLLLYGLLFGWFLIIYIARPLQRTAQVLDTLDTRLSAKFELPESPVWEVQRLRRATYALAEAKESAEEARVELERLATTDGLSGLFNRRCFNNLADIEWIRCRRYGRPLAVLMVDIDHFKLINDQYGHAAGDLVITNFGKLIRRIVRASDQAARIGGEEFAVLMPEATAVAAMNVAERICSEAACEVVTGTGTEIHYTVSVGVAVVGASDQDFGALAQRADSSLYRAKNKGRNCVVFADADEKKPGPLEYT
ncbi:GGDEF domain-containing protein [Propionivibrio dicarboxylicus]|uniref:GGDEF domain-containing protein n=1 Tax=Propionivibrio dicarboxylicus TaxID=83767 RepID=UPI0015A4B72E|nr:GGDEF domain-containing protein [Propionivibrio dicarboxylicus]